MLIILLVAEARLPGLSWQPAAVWILRSTTT
nr:MAG TPA_asm: hypothetical protein [Caudoviricetes sp.]